jgi:hypothetical protein
MSLVSNGASHAVGIWTEASDIRVRDVTIGVTATQEAYGINGLTSGFVDVENCLMFVTSQASALGIFSLAGPNVTMNNSFIVTTGPVQSFGLYASNRLVTVNDSELHANGSGVGQTTAVFGANASSVTLSRSVLEADTANAAIALLLTGAGTSTVTDSHLSALAGDDKNEGIEHSDGAIVRVSGSRIEATGTAARGITNSSAGDLPNVTITIDQSVISGTTNSVGSFSAHIYNIGASQLIGPVGPAGTLHCAASYSGVITPLNSTCN